MQTTQSVNCPLPGMEDVEVEYNMMASVGQMDAFMRSMGQQEYDQVIADVRHWPEEEMPGGPAGDSAPWAFRLWMVRTGLQEASRLYVTDPN